VGLGSCLRDKGGLKVEKERERERGGDLESGLKRTSVAQSRSTLALRHLWSRSRKSLVLQMRMVRSSEHEARYFPLLLKSRHVTLALWL